MMKNSVSWSITLFIFTMIVFAYKPVANEWGYHFDQTYRIPVITLPDFVYWIMGLVALVISLIIIVGAFNSGCNEKIGKFINNQLYYPAFIIFLFVYLVGFIQGIGSMISATSPQWAVWLAFCYGIFLFVVIVVMYFKRLLELRKNQSRLKESAVNNGENFDKYNELLSIDIVLDEVRRRLDFQFGQLDGFSTKAGIVLGIAGVVFALLINIWFSLPIGTTGLELMQISLIFIIMALILSFLMIFILRWNRSPNLNRLRDYYIFKDVKETKLNIIDKCMEGIDENQRQIDRLVCILRCAHTLLLVGLLLLVIWVTAIIYGI